MARPPITLTKSVYYPYPPEAVWTALTDPHAIAEWMMPNDFRAEVGATFTYQIDPSRVCPTYKADGRVVEVEPCRRLVYTLRDYPKKGPPRAEQTITWTLAPERDGTRLTLRHEGLEAVGFVERFMLRFGWGAILRLSWPKILARVAETGGVHTFEPGAIPADKRPYKATTVPDHLVR